MTRASGTGKMIEQTSVQISALRERWHLEREQRYARRNRIRQIDKLLDELEMLNIAEETILTPEDFVLPLFVRPGKGEKRAISSMPGHFQYSADQLTGPAREAASWRRVRRPHSKSLTILSMIRCMLSSLSILCVQKLYLRAN